MFATIARSLAELGPWEHFVFVVPASFTSVVAELTNAQQLAYWPRFREGTVGATLVMLYVDGAALRPRAIDCAKQSGVIVALEWPCVIGTDPATGAVRTWRGDEILS